MSLRLLAILECRADCHVRLLSRLCLLAGGICLGPLAVRHLVHLWGRPHYQFFPVMLIALAVIGVSRWREQSSGSATVSERSLKIPVHLPVMLLAIAAMVGALWMDSPWLGYCATVSMLFLFGRNVCNLAPCHRSAVDSAAPAVFSGRRTGSVAAAGVVPGCRCIPGSRRDQSPDVRQRPGSC